MQKNTTFFIILFLICASFSLSAQANIYVTTSNTDCYTGNEFVDDGDNTYNGVVRNTYNDGYSSHLVYNGSRWEIRLPSATGNLEFYNDADTAPNPPGLSVGTWIKGPGDGTTDCGTITAMTGGVQNTPLPIELTRFEGNHKEGYNHLTWQTASENQNKGFDIERSSLNPSKGGKIEWQKIGFVAGNGTTNTRKEYSFKDESPTGLVYYRLKQLDFDGGFEYSKIIAIDRKGEKVVSVFPNPSNGIFTITGIEDTEDETFTLINTVGQTLSINVQNDGQFDMSSYPSGVYYLRVASSGQVMKLVKE